MANLNNKEKSEMLRMAGSVSLRQDLQHISSYKHNPFGAGTTVAMDRFIAFLTEYNEFINHRKKPFKPIAGKRMKL